MHKPKERPGGGRALNLYVQKEDLDRLDKLSKFLSGNGQPFNSRARIIKTALQCVSMDDAFVNAYAKALESDERLKAKRTKAAKAKK